MIFSLAPTEVHSSKKSIRFSGTVNDRDGSPVSEALVQIWQTDSDGIYNHPDSNRGPIDTSFQYFGTDKTNVRGEFFFNTFMPGIYPGRPAHIHFKVWVGIHDVLTSQLYFEGKNNTSPLMLTLGLNPGVDFESGNEVLYTNKNITIDLGNGENFPLTPSQPEGPFYPVVDFFGYDNDITALNDGGQLVQSPSNNPVVLPMSIAMLSTLPVALKSETPDPTTSPTRTVTNIHKQVVTQSPSLSPHTETNSASRSPQPTIAVNETSAAPALSGMLRIFLLISCCFVTAARV